MAAGEQPVVQAEDGQHLVVVLERSLQGGMVVHAQVTAKPDQRGHGACLPG